MFTEHLDLTDHRELPIDPGVRTGILPNGFSYYVCHNEFPRNRANFYLVQKVGSSQEGPGEYGLSHFIEHMAFNGSRHFPGSDMLRQLEKKGIWFGRDINAYTEHEETVYNINNVPTDDAALTLNILQCIRDWCCDLLLEGEKIDGERKVILEEWRMRNDARFRFLSAMAPAIFDEPQYHLTPIGSMEVVMNAPHDAIRDFYHKWYRPDLQGIIIVGDFNPDEMTDKVIEMFSDIPAPSSPSPRKLIPLSNNEQPLFFAFEDPELPASRIDFKIKLDKLPVELQNTKAALVEKMARAVMATMFNNRLEDHKMDKECQYAEAKTIFFNFYPSKTKECFQLAIIPKHKCLKSLEDALSIVAAACQNGFTASELQRALAARMAQLDRKFNERNNTKSADIATGIIGLFKDNEPYMGISAEREFFIAEIASIPLDIFNKAAASLLTSSNRVILLGKQQDGNPLPNKNTTLKLVNKVLSRRHDAYIDRAIKEPLIPKLPVKGKVVERVPAAFAGTTELRLSNGIKVIVKPTDFKDDEILFQAFRKGGKGAYDEKDADNVLLMGDAFKRANFGKFDSIALSRYLTGKNVTLDYSTGQFTDYFEGSSSVAHLPVLMELIHTAFTNIHPNEAVFNNAIQRFVSTFKFSDKSPEFMFERHKNDSVYAGSPMNKTISAEVLNNADYSRIMELYFTAIANPADFTFLFIGNIDEDSLMPLLETYIASIPSGEKRDAAHFKAVDTAEGFVSDEFSVAMAEPADWIFGFYSGNNVECNIENISKVDLIGPILETIYQEVLREKEGGVYSPVAYSYFDIINGKWNVAYFLQTNSLRSAEMQRMAHELLLSLLHKGASPEQFQRAKGTLLSKYETKVRTNQYWQNLIRVYHVLGIDIATNHHKALSQITLGEFNSFIGTLYDGKNRIIVNMHGIPSD